MLAQRIAK